MGWSVINKEMIAMVIMGVCGAGKSTVGNLLAESVSNCTFLDADDFHPQSNKDKMRMGIPLSDADRIPWLETIRDALKKRFVVDGKTTILGCSALRRKYREILRSCDPNYKILGREEGNCLVKFVLLEVDVEVLASRLRKRAVEGDHFMPAVLLESQLELLEIDEGEEVFKVDGNLSAELVVRKIQGMFF